MREDGIIGLDEKPPFDEIKTFDKNRTDKSVPNAAWKSPTDEVSRTTKMNGGPTHLAYDAEHAVDLKTHMIVAARFTTPIVRLRSRWKTRCR